MVCDRCFQSTDQGEHGIGLCPYEARPVHYAVRPDDIPGGLEIHHGLCNEDGSPHTYYSRSEMRLECEKRGVMPWSEVYSEDKTKDARVRMDWLQSSEAKRQKAERDELRRAGIRPTSDRQRSAPKPTSPETKALIRRIVQARLEAHR